MPEGEHVVVGIRPALDGTWGGIYQYSLSTIDAAERLSQHRFALLVDDPFDHRIDPYRKRGWCVIPSEPPTGQGARLLRRLLPSRSNGSAGAAGSTAVVRRDRQAVWWRGHDIGLVLYPAPSALSFEVGVPYLMAVHDVQHRLQPEFAEVSHGGEWQRREYLYRNGTVHATAILADSEIGRQQLLSFYGAYGVDPKRVRVLPFVPAAYLRQPSLDERRRVRRQYKLPKRYLIYPGQFWPHKNHPRIIQALEQLKLTHAQEIAIAFCGSHSGDLREEQFRLVSDMADGCGVSSNVFNLGYVPDDDMAALYAEAVALVMPTMFGPTNIPPLEAWACGCPVLSSDIEGIREQLDGAAVLVDPRSVPAIAEGLNELWNNDALRQRLAAAGRDRMQIYTADHFRERLADILDEATQWAARSQKD